jgi:DNA-binding CsgD family transcriptional regulator
LGRLSDAAAILEGQLNPEHEDPQESILDVAGAAALGRTAIHLGDARLTRVTATMAQAMLDQTPPSFRRQGARLLALQAMAAGDPGGAHAWLLVVGEEERASIVPLFPAESTDEPDLVRIALAAGDRELAESAVAGAERRAEKNPAIHTIAGVAAQARGLLNADVRELARAVELLHDGPRPLALASALEDLGAATVKIGPKEQGVDSLSRALTIYANAGAAWDAGRVRSRLRAEGVRRRLTSSERPDSGWAAMTDSELVVAQLVAQGLTNREVAEQLFVSPHTVSTHLRRVFSKLDIKSRVELTRLAVDRDKSS